MRITSLFRFRLRTRLLIPALIAAFFGGYSAHPKILKIRYLQELKASAAGDASSVFTVEGFWLTQGEVGWYRIEKAEEMLRERNHVASVEK